MLSAQDVIHLLNLQPHPIEGEHFRETHRCDRRGECTSLQAGWPKFAERIAKLTPHG